MGGMGMAGGYDQSGMVRWNPLVAGGCVGKLPLILLVPLFVSGSEYTGAAGI